MYLIININCQCFLTVVCLLGTLSTAVEGADPATFRVMIRAVVLFIVAEVALQVFKRAEKANAATLPA